MDKLRLAVTALDDDFARLYSCNEGFAGGTDKITLPADETLTLFLISMRDYEVRAEGDVTVQRDLGVGDSFMRFYGARWKETESQSGRQGRLLVVNPSQPETPMVFELTEGPFAYAPGLQPVGRHGGTITMPDGITEVVLHEYAHQLLHGIG